MLGGLPQDLEGSCGQVGFRHKRVMPVRDHGARKIANEWKGLCMNLTKHGVGFPSADQLDGVPINAAAEERHGATRAKAAGVDIRT